MPHRQRVLLKCRPVFLMGKKVNGERKARLLAHLLVDSPWTLVGFSEVLLGCRSQKSAASELLAQRLIARFPSPVSLNTLTGYLLLEERKEVLTLSLKRLQSKKVEWATRPKEMRCGISPAATWSIPPIDSLAQLANLLEVSPRQLNWLSAHYGNHYLVKALRKRTGGLRIVESPKMLLKSTQRIILRDLLNRIPTHPAAHGYVADRSPLTFVQPHVNKPVVLRMDLQDFFPLIDGNRIWGLFRSLGYPYAVIEALTNLCTCWSEPSQILEATAGIAGRAEVHRALSLYHRRHLPQGAPTSPKLANLIAYRLDCRLHGLAASAGATYTRYADDLLFSGEAQLARSSQSFSVQVGAICLDEGFQLQYRKTRLMRPSTRQSAAGIVINKTTNLRRSEYDKLKAILCNCKRHGGPSQNRDNHPNFREHLLGRINWASQLNSRRGEKLKRLFDQVAWD